MLVQTHAERLSTRVQHLNSLNQLLVLTASLQFVQDEYQHGFNQVNYFMVVIMEYHGYIEDGELWYDVSYKSE